MRRAPSVLLPVLLALPLLLAGCSDEPELPSESAFAEGTCRVAAPDVLEVGRALPRLGDGGEVDRAVKDALRDAQDRLFAVTEGAEPQYRPSMSGLVEAVGAVRIRADGNTYESSLGDELRARYDDVLEACTSG